MKSLGVAMRRPSAALLMATVALVAGCDPPLDPKEYGETIIKLPQVEGADKPYPLPQLDEAPEADKQPAEEETPEPEDK